MHVESVLTRKDPEKIVFNLPDYFLSETKLEGLSLS